MTDFEEVREAVLAVHPEVLTELGDDIGAARHRLVDESHQRLRAGRYLVVVCGEFRRGKSSLLNALVDRKALFPVDMDVTTAVVSTLEWADTEGAVIHFAPADPGDPASAPAPKSVPLSEVADYVTEQANPRNDRQVARVELRAPIEQLRSGLVLVDTPGVGSLNVAHTAATRVFLPRADAILFVCSGVQPPGTIELDFLAQAVAQCPIVLTAVTMIDKVVDPSPVVEEARARVRRKLAETLGDAAADVPVIGVSANRRRKGAALGDDAQIEASGFPLLEQRLWGGLAATCGAAQLHRALDALEAALADGEAPLLNELAALAGDAALAQVDRDLNQEQAKLKQLRSNAGQWRKELTVDLETMSRSPRDRLSDAFEEVRERFRTDLDTSEALSEPAALVRRASDGMIDAVARAEAELAAVVTEIAGRYLRSTSVRLTSSAATSPAFEIDLTGPVAGPAGRANLFGGFRQIVGGGMAGVGATGMAMWAAGAVAGVVFSPVTMVAAPLVALVAGLFGGTRHHVQNEAAKRERAARQRLRDEVLRKIDLAKRSAERDFADKLRDATRLLLTSLEEHLIAATDSVEQSMNRLRDTRKRTAAERDTRRAELQTDRARYLALHTRLDALRQRVTALNGGTAQ